MTEEEKKKQDNIPEEKLESEEMDEETQGKESEEQKDAQFMFSAMRAPRQGIYEHLLSQLMAQAVICTDPLKRIKVTCETCLVIKEADQKELSIDYERVEVLNVVANALLNLTVRKIPDCQIDTVSIPWGFSETEENFKKFVEPWFKCQIFYWPVFLNTHCKWHKRHSFPYDIVIDEIIRNPFWSWFFDATSCLSPEGYATLRNNFAAWAIPQSQRFLSELTEIVSPTLYAEILGLTSRGKKGYAEKVKETAEMPVDENSVGIL
jgi:hypothetical protein